MALSNSRQSFEDCYEIMDKALAAKDGVRVGFPDREDATYLRMRMNSARTLDRNFNGERYGLSDPRRNTSDYDTLSFRLKHVSGMYWVYVEKRKTPEVVEEIKNDDKPVDIGPVRETITYRRF